VDAGESQIPTWGLLVALVSINDRRSAMLLRAATEKRASLISGFKRHRECQSVVVAPSLKNILSHHELFPSPTASAFGVTAPSRYPLDVKLLDLNRMLHGAPVVRFPRDPIWTQVYCDVPFFIVAHALVLASWIEPQVPFQTMEIKGPREQGLDGCMGQS